jgi:hypothetical protein
MKPRGFPNALRRPLAVSLLDGVDALFAENARTGGRGAGVCKGYIRKAAEPHVAGSAAQHVAEDPASRSAGAHGKIEAPAIGVKSSRPARKSDCRKTVVFSGHQRDPSHEPAHKSASNCGERLRTCRDTECKKSLVSLWKSNDGEQPRTLDLQSDAPGFFDHQCRQ